jgi:hypothetical protein
MPTRDELFIISALTVIAFRALIEAFAWTYLLNTWLEFLGKNGQVSWWQGALLAFVPVLGRFGSAAAVFTWALMLFLR